MNKFEGTIIYCTCHSPDCHILVHKEIDSDYHTIVYKISYMSFNKSRYSIEDGWRIDLQNFFFSVLYQTTGMLRRMWELLFKDIKLSYDFYLSSEDGDKISKLDPSIRLETVWDDSVVQVTNEVPLKKKELGLLPILHFIWYGEIWGTRVAIYEDGKLTFEDSYERN